ncbi:acetylpolyamine aminohydrolase [Variovorax paradoxus]|jgi:acetoin utilization deacetylase AcuC-like enzyme|uniref:histone deacetylase family protein n=1 Tax=Variovorax paradoxus TaxID=34073 RepID=UPI0006E55A0C|nr:acetylpolyamine aminohydrolase [Variovorax paradoxus]KPV11701.1 acetylpolyamine aminohydrolase [Variovorax paradoxus]KPV13328.1 acetylpolyamine aminohydrolase [Variovorax paradoxus]KPV20004.1 acetylpolyamine aminohydrolase [Variovorax paradoxus]KPV34841.1 acetylpolyamine aminohydrolase [Variovorax paradoxus]
MLTIYNDRHALHQGKVEMFRGELVPCFEVPARADHVKAEIERRALGPLFAPDALPDALLAEVHAPRYLDFIAGAWDEWVALDPANAERDALPSYWPTRGMRTDVLPASFPARLGLFGFDAGTPLTAGSWTAARHGAACAFTAAQRVVGGERAAFALTRPPGHHAGADFFGGYCFLNNAAVAAQALRDAGIERVAVLDVDYHHGNGTQAIFYARDDVHFASLHADPVTDYPYYLGHADERGAGAGLGFNHNLPLPRGTDFALWRAALTSALARIAEVKAGALVVSLGVDTFEGDPISGFRLRGDDYLRMGEDLARAGLPTVFVFEGGYAVAEVGVNAVNVLEGFEQA